MKYIRNLNWSHSLLSLAALSLILSIIGCGGAQGETETERSRRWKTVTESNMGQLNDDIDAVLMMDKRSRLTDKYIRDY